MGLVALVATSFFVSAHAADITSELITKGDQQWAAGNVEEAQKTFEQAVKAAPLSVEAGIKLGGLQLSRNDFSGSTQTYQHLIGIEPNNTKAWLGLGISYLHSGRNELSIAAFEEVIKIDPSRKEPLAPVIENLRKSAGM